MTATEPGTDNPLFHLLEGTLPVDLRAAGGRLGNPGARTCGRVLGEGLAAHERGHNKGRDQGHVPSHGARAQVCASRRACPEATD